MGTKKVSITLTRNYSKTATIEVDVDENLKGDELEQYLASNSEIDEELEDSLASQSLDGGEDEWTFQDPTDNNGGHL